MLSTFDLLGIQGRRVNVEVTLDPNGTQALLFGGASLSDAAVREMRVRVKSAIINSGFTFPTGSVLVFLDVPQNTPGILCADLAVAVGILQANGAVNVEPGSAFLGELGLDGTLRGVAGAVCMARAAQVEGVKTLYVPPANAAEAALVGGLRIVPVTSLTELVGVLQGAEVRGIHETPQAPDNNLDLADIRGQEHAKRALEIAAAGGHSILFIGSPGAGKTMLARRLTGLLPPMTDQEAIETAEVYSAGGLFSDGSLGVRPFRAPHHTISDIALTGGGRIPRPGEVALAHNGVLFLDEMPEFQRDALSQVGHTLQKGVANVSTARYGQVGYPARFQLVGSMSPCPCGHFGDYRHACNCSDAQIERYRARVAPFIEETFDLVVEVPPVPVEKLRGRPMGEKSTAVQERVVAARKRQEDAAAFGSITLDVESTRFLEVAAQRMGLSAQQCQRVVKVARTIANLDACPAVRVEHVAEAVQYSGNLPHSPLRA